MKFTCNSNQIKTVLKLFSKSKSSLTKSKVACLVDFGGVSFSYKSSSTIMRRTIDAEIKEPGTMLVGFQTLAFISKLSGVYEFTLQDNKLLINNDKSSWALNLVQKGDMFEEFEDTYCGPLEQVDGYNLFVNDLKKIAYAVGPENIDRDVFWVENNGVVVGDGSMLASLKRDTGFKATLPSNIIALSKPSDYLSQKGNKIFCIEDRFNYTGLMGLNYPCPSIITKLIDFEPKYERYFTVNREQLLFGLDTVKQINMVSNRSSAHIISSNGQLQLISNGELGGGITYIDSNESKGEIRIAANPALLINMLSQQNKETITVSMEQLESMPMIFSEFEEVKQYLLPLAQ